jgi:hypothetical protein
MTQATPYTRSTGFADDERNNAGGRSTVRTAQVDAEFDSIAQSLDLTISNLALLQRDDGVMRDGVVPIPALGADTLKLLTTGTATPRGAWVTATPYVLKDLVTQGGNTYICAVAHTSGTFATDLASVKWLLFQIGANPNASAIPFASTGPITSTTVQGAIVETDTNWRLANAAQDSALADTTDETKNAGRIGFNALLSYAIGTVGAYLVSFGTATGSSLIGWLRAGTSSVATTLQKWMGWQEINAFEFMTPAQIADYQAGAMTLDLTAPLQAWATACSTQGIVGRLPKGTPKITSPISLAAAATIRGHGVLSRIAAWGCDAFTVAGDLVTIDSLGLFGYSAGGAADPKTFSAIHVNGVSGTARNTDRFSNLYLQGWLNPINGEYMVDGTVHNVTTVNCTNGLRLFGQSVNNSLSDSHVVVTGGASILTVKDGATQGEGLMITGTKLAGGVNAIKSDGFLSIGLDSSCIIDIFSGKAFDFTGAVIGFKCDAQWVYSADSCFSFSDAGGATETNACVNPGFATCTGSANLFYWGTNNNGLKLGGCLYSVGGAGYPVSLNGGNADVRSYIKNGTAQAAVRVNTAGNTIEQTGDRSVEWAFSPVATLPSNNALVLPRNGCNVITISGTTNILSISAANWAGQEVTLIFQGALTVTDGSNLKLNSNFVTTADDTMRLACDGTNWYEISRSAN